MRSNLRVAGLALAAPLAFSALHDVRPQTSHRTLVAVLAHADDETAAAPVLARYARDGVRVYLIVATDGGQGTGSNAATAGSAGDELARVRADEARCAAQALGAEPPVLLGFADGKIGDYAADRSAIYRLTARVAEEIARLRPDAIITWGPDGGTGHPDHRLISTIVTQLVRAEAPGAPARVFQMYIPVEGFRAMNPARGEPPLSIPAARYFTTRVQFTPQDLAAAGRAMACHRSQFTPDVVQRVFAAQTTAWNGAIAFVPEGAGAGGTDLFR